MINLIKITKLEQYGIVEESYKYNEESYKFYKIIKCRPSGYKDTDIIIEVNFETVVNVMNRFSKNPDVNLKLIELKREIKLKDVI